MRKYQGEDIAFSVKLDNKDNATIKDFTDVSNVIIYAYTDEDSKQMFSVVSKDGYSPLLTISDTEISGVISSEYTSLMRGQIFIEVMVEVGSSTGDSFYNIISKTATGIFIIESKIKESI